MAGADANPVVVILVVLAVVLGVAAGALMLVIAYFCFRLLQTMTAVRASIGEFVKVMEPLVKTGALQELSKSAAGIMRTGENISKMLPDLNQTFKIFNRTFFKKAAVEEEPTPFAQPPEEGFAPRGASIKVSYSEEAAATQERAAELRREGLETEASRVVEPLPSEMHGAQV